MGMECPYGCGRQRVARYITADGGDAKKASETVAYKLTCGHVVGGEDFENFRNLAREIDVHRATEIRKIEEEARIKKASAYQAFVVNRGGK